MPNIPLIQQQLDAIRRELGREYEKGGLDPELMVDGRCPTCDDDDPTVQLTTEFDDLFPYIHVWGAGDVCGQRFSVAGEPQPWHGEDRWRSTEITHDPRITHTDPLLRAIVERLHRNKSMHLHQHIGANVCAYCALDASHALAAVRDFEKSAAA